MCVNKSELLQIKKYLASHKYIVKKSNFFKNTWIAKRKTIRKGTFVDLPIIEEQRFYFQSGRWHVQSGDFNFSKLIIEALMNAK